MLFRTLKSLPLPLVIASDQVHDIVIAHDRRLQRPLHCIHRLRALESPAIIPVATTTVAVVVVAFRSMGRSTGTAWSISPAAHKTCGVILGTVDAMLPSFLVELELAGLWVVIALLASNLGAGSVLD
jgi:hypothetical protein